MTTFVYRDLTISVDEMSRTEALTVCRTFDAMKSVYTEVDDLMEEADILCALSAPTAIKQGNGHAKQTGKFTVKTEDAEFVVTLPLTRDEFVKLPMSLTQAWVTASLESNNWFIDTLKKAFGLTQMMISASESGSVPSPELTATSLPIPTSGG